MVTKDCEELFACLSRRLVKAIIVGGYAFAFHAKPRFTKDIDVFVEPTPANAGAKALAAAGKSSGDVKRVEINEAFASVAKHSTRMLDVDEEIVNVNGGAVALGHPIGASGGRIVATMVHELRREGGGLGLASICSGGGQGDALLIEV